ncbi:unnamed protein product [Durusdinium trenchii]|uniref:EF-hand domain-containing protein n=1 Tax=Durusdinium trenchii TaxID=1381693 RepID=A0ABP0QXL2_9DINO
MLLQKRASPDIPNDEGKTPLDNAREKGHEGIVGLLTAVKATTEPQKAAEAHDKGQLLSAAENGNMEEIKRLLSVGVDLDAKGRQRKTSLHLAAEEGHCEVVNRLLAAKAAVEAQDELGNTPLHCAAQNGHTTIMDRLVAAGAAVDAKTNGGETPLHRVAYHGRSKAAQRLVALRADVDAKNDYGVTPWAYAEANGKQTQMGFVLRPVQVGLLSGRTVPCDPELSRTVRELLEEAQSKFGTRIHHLVTSSGTTLKEHVTLQDAGIGYASYVTAIASVHDDEVTSSAPRAEASVLAASEGPSGTEADSSQLLEKGAGYAHGSVEVSSPDPAAQQAVGCQSGELADARRSMQEEAQDEGFEYAASDLEQPAAQPVLHNVEEFQSAPFVKKIGFDWEEGHTYLDIELDNTAICSVRDDIVMMSSKSVHQSNSLGFEVLEDYDAPALPAGMVPMGPLLRLWPENVTFSEEVHVVMPVCRGAKHAWCTTDSGWKQVPVHIRQNIMITSLHHFCSMQPAGEPVEIKALGYIKQPSAKIVLAHVECHDCTKRLRNREKDPDILEDFTKCRDPELLDERNDGDTVELSQPGAFQKTIQLKFQRFPFVSPKLSARSGSFKVQIDDETCEFQLDRDADSAEVARPRQHASPQVASEQTSTGSAIHHPPEVRLKWEEPVVIEVDLSELLTKMDPGLYQVLAQERGKWHQVSEDLFLHIWTDANIARAQVAQRSLCLEHVEQVTSDLVRRICVALGLAFSSDMAKKLTKIVRCKQVTDLRWYDIFRHRAFSTINACAKRGASQILLVGVQPKMLNSITGEELRCLDKDLQHACEKKSFDLYHLLKGLECPIDRLEEELQEWLRKDAKHQVVIASCCEDDQEAARHICKRLNDGLDVLEYVDALSPEEVMWNLSISAIKKVVTQLDQDGFGMPAEKFGQAMRMLGMSATTMKVSTPSTKPIGILTLHDLLLEDLKNSATDPYDMLRKFLSLLDGDCKGTMSVAELKRFLGVGGMRSENELEATVSENRQAEIPLSKLQEFLFDPESQQKLLNDQQTASRISWAVADRNAFHNFVGPWSSIRSGPKPSTRKTPQGAATISGEESHKDSVAVEREAGRISVPIPVAPANGRHLFLSGRFNNPESKSYMRAVRAELERLGVQTYMVEGQSPSGDFGQATTKGLYYALAMVAFCSHDYGAKTTARYETYFELKTAHEKCIPIIPIQLCDIFPPEPPDEEGRCQNFLVFGTGLIRITDVGSKDPTRVAKNIQKTWLTLTRR